MRNIANRDCTTTIRGLAILLIIIGHVGVSGFGYRIFNPFGGIGVAIFLFLSGYGLTESYKKSGLERFWGKKIMRIGIPYLIWIPIYHIAVRLSFLGSTNGIDAIPRYWFIEYLLVLYILFYFLYKFCPKYILSIMTGIGILSFLTLNNLRAEQSFSFISGMIFSLNKNYFENLERRHLLTIAASLFIVGIIALLIKQLPQIRLFDLESIQFKCLNLLIKLPIGLSLLFLLLSIKPNGIKGIKSIGYISYELYLTHVSFFMSISGRITYLLFFIIQTFILAYILYYANKFITNFFSNEK